MKKIFLFSSAVFLFILSSPVYSTPKTIVKKPQIKQVSPKAADIAKFNALFAEVSILQEKARDLTFQFNNEYNLLVNEKIGEMVDAILAGIYMQKKFSITKNKKPADLFSKLGNVFKKKVFKKVEKTKPTLDQTPTYPTHLETPWGKVLMSDKMISILKELDPIEGEIDLKTKGLFADVDKVPDLNRARLISMQLDINLRRIFRTLHSEVFGLGGSPDCQGDLISGGFLWKYLDNFLTGNYPEAFKYFHAFFNQTTCISARQNKSLDRALFDAYNNALYEYAKEKKPIPGAKDNARIQVNTALYNLALLVYDNNKASFSVWQTWFCMNGEDLVAQYQPDEPLYNFGIWLQDRVNGAITSVKFNTSSDVKFSCPGVVDEAVISEVRTFYGAFFQTLAEMCDDVPISDDPVYIKTLDIPFAMFNSDIVNPDIIGLGILGFLNTAAIGNPDTFGFCGGGGVGGTGGGGPVTCAGAGGGGAVHECALTVGSWPVLGGTGMVDQGPAPLPVDVVKLRAAALCGSTTGDPQDDVPFVSAMGAWGKGTSEKEWEAEKTAQEKEDANKVNQGAKDGMDELKGHLGKIKDNFESYVASNNLGLEWNEATFLAGAGAALNDASVGGGVSKNCPANSVCATTDGNGNVSFPGTMLPGGAGYNPVDWAHEGTHAGLVALGLETGAKDKSKTNPKTGKSARIHHLITGDSGLGYSNYYPNPNSNDSSFCTLQAMGSYMSASNCHEMSGSELKDWCSKLDADCMGGANAYGGWDWNSSGDQQGQDGGMGGAYSVGTTSMPDPDNPNNFSGLSGGPCQVGGGPVVDMLILEGGGVVDPMCKDAGLSNWMIDRYNKLTNSLGNTFKDKKD